VAGRVAIQIRHQDIDQNQFGWPGGDDLERAPFAGGRAHFVATAAQNPGQHGQVGRSVDDDEHVAHAVAASAIRPPCL
jgi:hypothetical protein